MRTILLALFHVMILTPRLIAQAPPPATDYGSSPTSAQYDVIISALDRYYSCVFLSGAQIGCNLYDEQMLEMLGQIEDMLSLLEQDKIRLAPLGSGANDPAALTPPDLVDDGSWSNGQGVDAWTSASPNGILLNSQLINNYLYPCVYGAILLHEASHWDDVYVMVNGSMPTAGDACVFAFEELRARELEKCILECCAELCSNDALEIVAIGMRVGHLSGYIDAAEAACEDACGTCPTVGECDHE